MAAPQVWHTSGTSGKRDDNIKTTIANITGVIATDAASGEMKAGRLTKGTSSSDYASPSLTNIVLHVKNPSHGSTRFTKTWRHDEFLWDVFKHYVWGKEPVSNLIDNNDNISFISAQECKSKEDLGIDGGRINDMKFCKPRFNSTAAPLSRNTLFHDATWSTAGRLSIVKEGTKPSRIACEFLAWVDVEKYCQLGMMSDGADEALYILRFFDAAFYALAAMPTEIQTFLTVLHHLYVADPPG
ncbi:hypothetical protein N9L68_04000 [bacterium]|nr:hypothetical protein [bacterium]